MRSIRPSPTLARTTIAFLLVLFATLGLCAAPASAAPIGWQVTGGYYTEFEQTFLGAGARLSLTTITVIPSVEWMFVDNGNAYTLNLDATMSVLPLGVASGYVGAGLGLLTTDPTFSQSSSDMTVNLIVGAGLDAIPLKPFGQIKYVVVDGNDPVVFSLGVRF